MVMTFEHIQELGSLALLVFTHSFPWSSRYSEGAFLPRTQFQLEWVSHTRDLLMVHSPVVEANTEAIE